MNKDIDNMIKAIQDIRNGVKTKAQVGKEHPEYFITKAFQEEMQEARLDDVERSKMKDKPSMRLAIKIPEELYHTDPEFWKHEMKNRKAFKRKYPWFVV
jgi:predicted nucleotidyltransferase